MTKIIDASKITIENEIIYHVNNKMIRKFPISNMNRKKYYYFTDIFSPGSFVCRKSLNTHYKISIHNDQISFISKLNNFKADLIDRIKYRVHVSKIVPQSSYHMIVNKINNSNYLKNIICYQNNIIHCDADTVREIFKVCRCKLLVQIIALVIYPDNAFLELRVSRVYPESLDELDIATKTKITNLLYAKTISNIGNLKNLENIKLSRYVDKKTIKNELEHILC